jgi:hypothetical protein
MSTLLLTLLIAFVIVAIAISLLAIGWLITGKSKISPGSCGRDPTKKRNDQGGCGSQSNCSLCEPEKEKKVTEDKQKQDE